MKPGDVCEIEVEGVVHEGGLGLLTILEREGRIHQHPRHAALPGPLVQALAYESMRQDRMLRRTGMLPPLALCLLLVYAVMASLFESFLQPAAILVTCLLGCLGAPWAMWATGTVISPWGEVTRAQSPSANPLASQILVGT